jgi:hypothetical protein
LIGDLAAWKNEDLKTLTAFELFYDAIATAAMNHLRLPVQKYALVLQQMIALHQRKRHRFRTASIAYPNRAFSKSFGARLPLAKSNLKTWLWVRAVGFFYSVR